MSQVTLGLTFFVSGCLKVAYDLTLWRWFKEIPLPDEGPLSDKTTALS